MLLREKQFTQYVLVRCGPDKRLTRTSFAAAVGKTVRFTTEQVRGSLSVACTHAHIVERPTTKCTAPSSGTALQTACEGRYCPIACVHKKCGVGLHTSTQVQSIYYLRCFFAQVQSTITFILVCSRNNLGRSAAKTAPGLSQPPTIIHAFCKLVFLEVTNTVS